MRDPPTSHSALSVLASVGVHTCTHAGPGVYRFQVWAKRTAEYVVHVILQTFTDLYHAIIPYMHVHVW